jgi:hypothetical protein
MVEVEAAVVALDQITPVQVRRHQLVQVIYSPKVVDRAAVAVAVVPVLLQARPGGQAVDMQVVPVGWLGQHRNQFLRAMPSPVAVVVVVPEEQAPQDQHLDPVIQ